MTATKNLGITKINESDYIVPDPINKAFDKFDENLADGVIEYGTKGDWWYRKWRSGRLECGVDAHNFGTYTTSTNWGSAQGIYVGGILTFGAFPVAFAEIPFYTVSLVKADYNGMAGWIGMGGSNTPGISSVSRRIPEASITPIRIKQRSIICIVPAMRQDVGNNKEN